MSQPSDMDPKLKAVLIEFYSPERARYGMLAKEPEPWMCMDCGKGGMSLDEMKAHHCPPGKCHTIGCNDPRHEGAKP